MWLQISLLVLQLAAVKQVMGAGVSLAFVFDSTGSMGGELRQAQKGATKILNAALNHPQQILHNFVLVPFNDPDVGPVTVTQDRKLFEEKLANIKVHGGDDCPEASIGGIMKALEVSEPRSFIYVFTDAAAKDYGLTDRVIALIQLKRSKVIFVMTGDCGDTTEPGYLCYGRIASASNGQVFVVDKGQVSKVLDSIILTTLPAAPKVPKNPVGGNSTGPSAVYGDVNVISIERNATGSKRFDLSVDSQLLDMTFWLSGEFPSLTIRDPTGRQPKITKILDLRNVLVVKVDDPEPGNWTVSFSSKTAHTLRITGTSDLSFDQKFGDTPMVVDFKTALSRPIEDMPVYTYILGSGLAGGVEFDTLDFLMLDGDSVASYDLNLSTNNPFMYGTRSSGVAPSGLFNLQVSGTDRNGYPFIRSGQSAISVAAATGLRQCLQCAKGGTSRCVVLGKVDRKNVNATKFQCQCKAPHFTGDGKTCTNVNECAAQIDNCNYYADCKDNYGGFDCKCKPGFLGNGITCKNINECSITKNICRGTGKCKDTAGSYACECNPGYQYNNVTAPLCTDVNECIVGIDKCDAKAICTNSIGSYGCRCKPGYTGNGFTCPNVDECQRGTYKCDSKSYCVDTVGSYACVCKAGYKKVGSACVDVDECKQKLDVCHSNYADCINTNGSYTCSCIYGFEGDGFNCTEVDPSNSQLQNQNNHLYNAAATLRAHTLEIERQQLEIEHEKVLRQCALKGQQSRNRREIISMTSSVRKRLDILIYTLQVHNGKMRNIIKALKKACRL